MGRLFELEKGNELRIEVGWSSINSSRAISITLIRGSAEIFGTQLAPGRWLHFPPGDMFAVYTWDGAVIEMDGNADRVYVAAETPMQSYLNVHSMLETRRSQRCDGSAPDATGSGRNAVSLAPMRGPRVIMVGPTDSGKTSISKMLLGWAVRQGWKPIYVDLDIGQGSITIPGTIAATCVDSPVDPVEGISFDAPLVYFYGHNTPSVDGDLYKALVKELARALDVLFPPNSEASAAGMVINTMGWVEGLGYELLLHAMDSLQIDVVLVLGQEKLCRSLQEDWKGENSISILKLEKSGGVVSRNSKVRHSTRNSRTMAYFYGLGNVLSPHAASASFSDLHIFRVDKRSTHPRSRDAFVGEPMDKSRLAIPITINENLNQSVLAMSFAKKPEELPCRNIAGFIYVVDVDTRRKKLSYLAPCPGPLPNNLLLVGSLWWVNE